MGPNAVPVASPEIYSGYAGATGAPAYSTLVVKILQERGFYSIKHGKLIPSGTLKMLYKTNL